MMDHGEFEVTQTCDLPKGAKVLSTTWVLGLFALMSWVATIIIAGTMETANRVNALLSWVVWVVTILIAGTKEMQEQVGWKIERDHTERWMKVACKIEQK
jgi:hypothetical protein